MLDVRLNFWPKPCDFAGADVRNLDVGIFLFLYGSEPKAALSSQAVGRHPSADRDLIARDLIRQAGGSYAAGFEKKKAPVGTGACIYLEPTIGIEPTTACLQDRGSTIELRWQILGRLRALAC